jgi:hypothetical protein
MIIMQKLQAGMTTDQELLNALAAHVKEIWALEQCSTEAAPQNGATFCVVITSPHTSIA